MTAKKAAPDETPEQILADAQAAIDEADQLAADLEQRVREGDETVTLADIKTAKDAGWFARLRLESRQKKAAELEVQREADRRAAIIAEHLPLLQCVQDKIDPLVADAVAKIEAALEHAEEARRARVALRGIAGARNPYYPNEDEVEKDQFGSVYYGGREYGIVSTRMVLQQIAEHFGIRDIKNDFEI